MGKRLELQGQRFNRLLVVSFAGLYKGRWSLWNCVCDCGGTVVARPSELKAGKTKSCGCLNRELTSARNKLQKGARHARFKGGIKNQGSVAWCGQIINTAKHGAKKHGHAPLHITPEQLAVLWQHTGEICPICLKNMSGRKVVDHCHETGRVRGIICFQCNVALGMIGDDLAGVSRAADYLSGGQFDE